MKRIIVGSAVLAIIALAVFLWLKPGQAPLSQAPEATKSAPPQAGAQGTAVRASTSGAGLPEMAMGSADAPLTIIEYASLTCPHCAAFQRDTVPELKKEYIDTGLVRWVYRDFPLDSLALAAAMLARCSGPERYFGFVEVLFRSQSSWANSDNPRLELARIARLANMPEETFEACLKDSSLLKGIQAGAEEAKNKYAIDSTPTFIVGDRKLPGAVPFKDFKEIIDVALKK